MGGPVVMLGVLLWEYEPDGYPGRWWNTAPGWRWTWCASELTLVDCRSSFPQQYEIDPPGQWTLKEAVAFSLGFQQAIDMVVEQTLKT